MAELDILRLSSTAAAQRAQQLFQEMETDESIFRNAVMAADTVIQDLKQEETAISQRRSSSNHGRAESVRSLVKQEVQFIDIKQQQQEKAFNSKTNGNYVIRDPNQWGFPGITHAIPQLRMSGRYKPEDHLHKRLGDIIANGFAKGRPQRDNISRDYLWMLDLAIR